jgi:hypothetical protein
MQSLFLVAGALLVAFPQLLGWLVALWALRLFWTARRR